ncbi:S-layer homology domain-containing protein, partial [Paenibacillus sp. GCM10012307]
ITEPQEPSKPGYNFSGWYKEAELTNAWNFENDTVPAGDITLYAKWNLEVPAAPQIQTVVSGDATVSISWTEVPFAAGYRIYQSSVHGQYSDPVATVDGSTYSYLAENLTNGVSYYFVVKAVNEAGESSASNEVNATPQVPAPGAPVLEQPVAGNSKVSLTWNLVDGSTGYKIYQSVTPDTFGDPVITVSDSVHSYDVTGLTNGTTYYFLVKATNPGGDSPASNVVSATPVTVPGIPTNVVAVSGSGTVKITFTPPADNGGSAITGYEVFNSNGDLVATGDADSSSITVTGLTNGTTYVFTVKAKNAVGSSDSSERSNYVVPYEPSSSNYNDSPSSDSSETQPADKGVNVLVNGKVIHAGTAITEEVRGQKVTRIVLDEEKLQQRLEAEAEGAVITIPVSSSSEVIIGELNGNMVKSMEKRKALLEVQTGRGSYLIPAQQINIDAISKQFGANIELKDIKIWIEIAAPSSETVQLVKNAASANGLIIAVPPVNFSVKAVYGDRTVEVTKFNAYVERTIAIPEGVAPNRLTTGVVVEPDGTVRHVPTKIVLTGGKYFAKINSLTNSTYTIVWHPVEFKDVANHWAKQAINNMGSRMVIQGAKNGQFSPDRDITRAEFAAIVVRGLGLKLENSQSSFVDVKSSDWYSQAIQTAHEYQLINGFKDGTFRPNEKITREQAMLIVSKAMAITGLQGARAGQSGTAILQSFSDSESVSQWALSGVADSVSSGVISGKNGNMLAPQTFITRAEVATIMQRLLQKSNLINE